MNGKECFGVLLSFMTRKEEGNQKEFVKTSLEREEGS